MTGADCFLEFEDFLQVQLEKNS